MKIANAITIARDQFIQNFNNGIALQQLENYAVEELGMTSEKAKAFAKNAVDGRNIKELTTEKDKFFIWYYINYIASKPALS